MLLTLGGLLFLSLFAALGAWRGALRILWAFGALLLAGLLAFPLNFLTSWAVGATGMVPKIFLPLAGAVTTGIGLFVVLMIPGEIWLRQREYRRFDEDLPPKESWQTYLGALLGAGWGTCVLVLLLMGICTIVRVDRAMREANAEIDYRAARRQKEEQHIRYLANLAHERPKPVSMEVELAEVDSTKLKLADPAPSMAQLEAVERQVDGSLFAPLVHTVNPVEQKQEFLLRDLAVVTGDPVLMERFQAHPEVVRLSKDPRLVELSKDQDVAAAIHQGRFRELMDNPKVIDVAQDKDLRKQLVAMKIDLILKDVKSGKKLPAPPSE